MNEIFEINHLPNRVIEHNGQEYLFFSGTAYLGLPQNPAFQQITRDALGRYGTVFGSSRNGNLRLTIYEVAESKLAAWVMGNVPNATSLTLSSGMMAGQVIVNWLRGQATTFMYAPKSHPALWYDPNVTLPSLSFPEWVNQLPDQLRNTSSGHVAILVNSLDAVASAYYNFDWVRSLPEDRPITLIVDDSHGLGVLNEGRGIWPEIRQKLDAVGSSVRLLITASLAKAMGLPGGVVFGDSATLQSLRQTAFFGACSPMPPAYLEAYCHADTLYTEGYKRLMQNILLAEKLLLPSGIFQHSEGYPVFFTERDDLYQKLLNHQILIYSFAYPTAADRANTRIVISAFHTSEDIKRLADFVNTYCS
ncbi:aminotransferase class I/II-fold pyridoxal phosphate-dependent enzyme [Spirosoma sp. BT702]|uniref:Aminotransferase class I/II-fold pyridoxal phosphate-dependent enzyme n=1 Tax=Spirosoma profusum TaxID=2771354 RepID=A0A926XUZ2_9BACT|nr:aminotransferase class I/II-fold pyridoxal phosphate-dependent enzyme [Spirosoma profusum]MBD2700988.1 aminotransferase class I/II-fold pyridoxal phosphate-dependent enzyme [Spirosoma profusum]